MWEVINQRAQLIREPNEVRILRLVRDSGEISRVEIAKACNLNKAYVTELVAKLIQSGFLEETGKVEVNESVGRKRILLRFIPLAGLVVGVDIGMTHSTVVLSDLNATVLQHDTFHYPLTTSAKEVQSSIVDCIRQLLRKSNHSESKLVGIGVAVQGLIDYRTNSLMVSHNKKSWEGESLSNVFEKNFEAPVYVENDVKTMTLSEYLIGAAKGVKNFVHVFIGDGLGAGIMINGHVHRGFTSSAGEIGYTELEPSSYFKEHFPMLFNGQVIFGQILTDTNIIESYFRHAPKQDQNNLTVREIANKVERGDPIAQMIVEEFSSLISMLSINLINALNPELILIGGALSQHCPTMIDLIREKIHKDLLSVPAEAVRVKAAAHGESGVALGATSLVLYELFEPLHTISLRAPNRASLLKNNTAKAV